MYSAKVRQMALWNKMSSRIAAMVKFFRLRKGEDAVRNRVRSSLTFAKMNMDICNRERAQKYLCDFL